MKKSKRKSGPESKSLFYYYRFKKSEQKKYPVVTGILKQLTPERIKEEIEEVKKVELPPELKKWVKEYEKVGERDGFLWKLFLSGIKDVNYINTEEKYKKSLLEAQFLVAMFVVMLDDVADSQKDSKLLKELLKIAYYKNCTKQNNLNKKKRLYLNFSIKIWNRINALIKPYPHYKKFKENFDYDIKQLANAIDFDYIISRNPYLVNKAEYWMYSFHTMYFVFTDGLYLMCAKNFDNSEINAFRDIFWHAKKMVRIGNWLSTWEKEIKKGDFSSGVFAYAVDSKIITPKELADNNYEKIIEKIKKSNIESELLKEWAGCYEKIFNFAKKGRMMSVNKLLYTLRRLLLLELISKNLNMYA